METFIIGLIAVLVVFGILTYNSLVHKKANVSNAESGIDVQLTKRQDLIIKLVEVAKQYMKFESETLTQIVKLRTQAMQAPSLNERMQTENQLSNELSKLQISFENYPDLKTNTQFIEIQRALHEIEEQLAAARRTFNAAVTAYNVALEAFPSSLMASAIGYQTKPLFVAEEKKREDVDMKKLFNS